ncbi:hypothetical protein L2E82_36437 [Cichorium intybus]|uniref:Uncharacterized protein n=1 Tax=Cichorium intybus TaxID=13427 RepID=A0ACB9BRH3_CICIN|nr:hypothetical protein L2E82_36437 [Cichorium intybus]
MELHFKHRTGQKDSVRVLTAVAFSAITTGYMHLKLKILVSCRESVKRNYQGLVILEGLVESGSDTMDVRNRDEVILRMKAAVASKQYGQEAVLRAYKFAQTNPVNFNVDNVRVAKLVGGGLHNYTTVRGTALKGGDTVGSIKKIENAKLFVSVY